MRGIGIIILAGFMQLTALGQGCSDAGFCTIPSFKPLDAQEKFKLELKASLEGSEPGALIISPQIWFSYAVSSKVNLSAKLPFWFVNDADLGNLTAFNDPIISASFNVFDNEKVVINATAGFRIGINNANQLGNMDISLPMDYQSSLGTTDLIIGAGAVFSGFSTSLAIQYPLVQYNENQNVVTRYANGNGLNPNNLSFYRKPDIMFRIDKRFTFGHWSIQAGILPIFHLGNDELRGSSTMDETIAIEGSNGVTVNIPFGAAYAKGSWLFGLEGGVPVLVRDERPDGLTRRFVIQPRIAYTF